VIQKKFGGLKSRRQFRLRRVLDDARPGETDHRARLGQDQIAEARVARHNARRGRMREDADVGQIFLRVIRECSGSFRHLHEAEHSLIHPRAAAGGDDDDRQRFFRPALDEPGQLFADDRTHRAAEKIKIHDAQRSAVVADLAEAGHNGVLERGVFLVGVELGFIGRSALEIEDVHAGHARVHFLERAGLDERMNPLARADGEMMVALRADFQVLVQLPVENHRPARRTFRPKTLGHLAFLVFGLGRAQLRLFGEGRLRVRDGRRRERRLHRRRAADGFLQERSCVHLIDGIILKSARHCPDANIARPGGLQCLRARAGRRACGENVVHKDYFFTIQF